MANDDDFMAQIFSSVQLPEVRYVTPDDNVSGKQSMEFSSSNAVITTSEKHIESSHVVITHSHSEHHQYVENNEYYNGDDHQEHHHDSSAVVEHLEHYGSESDMSKHSEHHHDSMNEIFNRPTNDTFKVENGIIDSDVESRSQHNGEDEHVEVHDKIGEMLASLPQKTEQHDSLIEELRHKQHTRSDSESSSSSSSSDSTLKDEYVHVHEHVEVHTADDHNNHQHYDEPPVEAIYVAPPEEPEPDYESEHEVVVHQNVPVIVPEVHVEKAPSVHSRTSSVSSVQSHQSRQSHHSNHSQQSHHSHKSNHSQRSNHSQQSQQSHHSKASSHKAPLSRSSRASSVSTLVSEKQVPIHVNHTTHEPDEQYEYDYDQRHTVNEMKNFYTSQIVTEGKGIYKIRQYGSGSRSGTNSQRSSVSSYDDHEDQYNNHHHIENHDQHDEHNHHHHHHNQHHGIGIQHVIIEDRKTVQKPPQRNIITIPQTPGEIDEGSIQSVGRLQELFGGRAPPTHYAPNTHKTAKRESNASSVSRSTVRSESTFINTLIRKMIKSLITFALYRKQK